MHSFSLDSAYVKTAVAERAGVRVCACFVAGRAQPLGGPIVSEGMALLAGWTMFVALLALLVHSVTRLPGLQSPLTPCSTAA